MVTTRRGTTLVELLAAIPLLALLALVGAMLVLNGQRVSRSVDGRTTRTREMRHAAVTIAAELRSARSTDLHAWNDTLLEFDATVGFGFICDAPTVNRVDLLPAIGTDPLRSTWNSMPETGDRLALALSPSHPTEPPTAHDATIVNVGTSTTACGNATIRTAVPGAAVRLTLAPPPPATPIVGSPARIARRTRISLYRTGDNEWFVGHRTLRPSGWETIQPVAGPFASAANRGLRFTVVARDGTPLAPRATTAPPDTSIDTSPIAIHLLLRAASTWQLANGSRESDSLVTIIALRNR